MPFHPKLISGLQYPGLCDLVAGEPLPLAFVDLDAFDHNLQKLDDLAKRNSRKVRIATKSIRNGELIQRALRFSERFQGVMCFAAAEARYLAELGIDDILVAYPTVQRSDLLLIKDLHLRGKTVSLVCDSVEHLICLADIFEDTPVPFPILFEIDLSLRLLSNRIFLGVRRSPIRTVEALTMILEKSKNFPQLIPVGVMGYEAQVAGLGDRSPFKSYLNPLKSWVREASIKSCRKKREKVAAVFENQGLPLKVFNGGGSGSIDLSLQEPWLTEVTAGSALLCPHLFDYYSNIQFQPAAFFALQAVRSSDPGMITCQGGGYVASGEPGWDKVPVPYLPEGAHLVSAEACGEVQTPLVLAANTDIRLGAPVFFRHAKAGELAERFLEYRFVSNGKWAGRSKTYRGDGQCFF